MSSERLVIRGGKRLVGEVSICGGKNAALAVIPAALLTNDVCTIENLPDIDDIDVLSQMLAYIGAKVTITGRSMTIDPSGVDKSEVPADLASRIRGSSYFLGFPVAAISVRGRWTSISRVSISWVLWSRNMRTQSRSNPTCSLVPKYTLICQAWARR